MQSSIFIINLETWANFVSGSTPVLTRKDSLIAWYRPATEWVVALGRSPSQPYRAWLSASSHKVAGSLSGSERTGGQPGLLALVTPMSDPPPCANTHRPQSPSGTDCPLAWHNPLWALLPPPPGSARPWVSLQPLLLTLALQILLRPATQVLLLICPPCPCP